MKLIKIIFLLLILQASYFLPQSVKYFTPDFRIGQTSNDSLTHNENIDWDFGNVPLGNNPSPENFWYSIWNSDTTWTVTFNGYLTWNADWLSIFPLTSFTLKSKQIIHTIVTATTYILPVGKYSDTVFMNWNYKNQHWIEYGIISVNIVQTTTPDVNVSQLDLNANHEDTALTTFYLSNTGNFPLYFKLRADTLSHSITKLSNHNIFFSSKKETSEQYQVTNTNLNFIQQSGISQLTPSCPPESHSLNIEGEEVLILDDGNDTPDTFLGWNNNKSFFWFNFFTLMDFDFKLEKIQFYMRTENADTNNIYIEVGNNDSTIIKGTVSMGLVPNGAWYTIILNPIQFKQGEIFYVMIEPLSTDIGYPAGVDKHALHPNQSYYYDPGTNSIKSLNSISGFDSAAFLIRAVGSVNDSPVAVALVSPAQALVGQTVSFDASQSYDNDGEITSYHWFFGDGYTSTDIKITHCYQLDSNYTCILTVTDDQGDIDQKIENVAISDRTSGLIFEPAEGTIPSGDSMQIKVYLKPEGLEEGNYISQVYVQTNGEDIIIPVHVYVSPSVDLKEKISTLPKEFSLLQNYPNPFNPSTQIAYDLPKVAKVILEIYNVLGEKVKTLVEQEQSAGRHQVIWNGKNERGEAVNSGVHFYRLQTDEYTATRKMILMR